MTNGQANERDIAIYLAASASKKKIFQAGMTVLGEARLGDSFRLGGAGRVLASVARLRLGRRRQDSAPEYGVQVDFECRINCYLKKLFWG